MAHDMLITVMESTSLGAEGDVHESREEASGDEQEAPDGETVAAGSGKAPLVLLLVLVQAILLVVLFPWGDEGNEIRDEGLRVGPLVEFGPVVLPILFEAKEGEELRHLTARMLAVELKGSLSESRKRDAKEMVSRMGPHLRLTMAGVVSEMNPDEVFQPKTVETLRAALVEEIEKRLGTGTVEAVYLDSLLYH